MLKTAPIPEGEQVCDDFSVALNGEAVCCHAARVSAMPYNTVWPGRQRPLDQTETASFFSFEADETVTVRLEAKKPFSEVVVRPLSENIAPKTDGQTIEFEICRPGQYVVECDGFHNALHIFANPPADFGIDKTDPSVIYFPPGVHRPGTIEITDGQTVYIDAGAVVYGAVLGIGIKNARVVGYGIIDGSEEIRDDYTLLLPTDIKGWPEHSRKAFSLRNGVPVPEFSLDPEGLREFLATTETLVGCIRFYNCMNIEINGVICRDAASFAIIPAGCFNVVCDNVKLIGMWRYNSDGIDFFNSANGIVKNSFLRNFDDCMVLKGIKGWDGRNMENILVRNCVVWCDWGRALEIGAETCADEYKNIIFEDCDIIHSADICLDIQNGDRAHVHNVTFQNIRCEFSKYQLCSVYQHDMAAPYPGRAGERWPALFCAHGYCGVWSEDNKLGKIDNVMVKDIYVYTDCGAPMPASYIEGAQKRYSTTEHNTENVTFDGIYHNGKRLASMAEANISIEAATTGNVRFR